MTERILSHRFSYMGPKVPCVDADCVACEATLIKRCLAKRGDGNHDPNNCGLCSAVAVGFCGAHGKGAERAMDEHEASLVGDHKGSFETERAFIDAKLAL